MDHLSHPYMTTGKTIALTIWIFINKIMSLVFNMLSRCVIAFLPRRKHLLISWLQSPTTVILEPKKIKSFTVSIAPPSICHEVMGPDAIIFVFLLHINRDIKVLPNLAPLQTYLLVLSIVTFEQSPGPPWAYTSLPWLQLQSLQAGPPSQGAAPHHWDECRQSWELDSYHFDCKKPCLPQWTKETWLVTMSALLETVGNVTQFPFSS